MWMQKEKRRRKGKKEKKKRTEEGYEAIGVLNLGSQPGTLHRVEDQACGWRGGVCGSVEVPP